MVENVQPAVAQDSCSASSFACRCFSRIASSSVTAVPAAGAGAGSAPDRLSCLSPHLCPASCTLTAAQQNLYSAMSPHHQLNLGLNKCPAQAVCGTSSSASRRGTNELHQRQFHLLTRVHIRHTVYRSHKTIPLAP